MTTGPEAAFWSGLAVGLAVAIPVGPMSLLCIQRSLAFGMRAGLCTGLGTATVHGVLGGAAASGFSLVPPSSGWAPIFTLASAAVLFWFAASILCRNIAVNGDPAIGQPAWRSYIGAAALGFSNPLTFLLFAAAAPALAAQGEGSVLPAVAGLVVGSAGWWTILSLAVTLLRQRLNQQLLAGANTVAGLFLMAFGLVLLAGAVLPGDDASATAAVARPSSSRGW